MLRKQIPSQKLAGDDGASDHDHPDDEHRQPVDSSTRRSMVAVPWRFGHGGDIWNLRRIWQTRPNTKLFGAYGCVIWAIVIYTIMIAGFNKVNACGIKYSSYFLEKFCDVPFSSPKFFITNSAANGKVNLSVVYIQNGLSIKNKWNIASAAEVGNSWICRAFILEICGLRELDYFLFSDFAVGLGPSIDSGSVSRIQPFGSKYGLLPNCSNVYSDKANKGGVGCFGGIGLPFGLIVSSASIVSGDASCDESESAYRNISRPVYFLLFTMIMFVAISLSVIGVKYGPFWFPIYTLPLFVISGAGFIVKVFWPI